MLRKISEVSHRSNYMKKDKPATAEKSEALKVNIGTEDKEKQDRIKAVAKLVREIIGNRSIRKAAEDADVAASYLSGILNERYLPSANILRKIASPEAKPQNGITDDELMVAAGFLNEIASESRKITQSKELGYTDTDDNLTDSSKNKKASKKESDRSLPTFSVAGGDRRLSRQELERDEAASIGIVYKSLAEQRIRFELDDSVLERGFRPKLKMHLFGERISEWWFMPILSPYRDNFGQGIVFDRFLLILGRLAIIEPKKNRKISLIVISENVYHMFERYKDKLALKGDISLIYMDLNSYTIMKEDYLSHYKDESSELYLKQK